ncbi:MAG TPA: glycosyltransferase family 4 protein [Hyphomonas sp.]|nr:glycosyltransferase family 4 protein [Hyphomonas sp.]
MHILFLTDNFPPEVNAPASRTFEHAREWVRAGHQVTIVTGAPNFPTGRLLAGYRNRLRQSEMMDGIRVIRVWTYITANEGFLRRSLDYLSFMVMGGIAALFVRKPDVVVGTSPQFFTVLAAFIVAFVKRRPFVFELRDIWPASIKAVGALRDGWLLRRLEALELFLYRRAKAVIAVTHAFKDELVRRGIDGAKIHVVTNGADLSRFSSRHKPDELTGKLNLDGKFVAGYVGTHGMAHGLETLLEAAHILGNAPGGRAIRIVLLGDGARKAQLRAQADAMKLRNVLFLDTVPKEKVADYWALLDVSIIHLKRDPLFKTVIPSKLFECMAMGIPVLHGVEGESADIVLREQVGLCFEPENAQALAEGLRLLSSNLELRQAFRENAIAAAPQYDRTKLAARVLEELNATTRN